MHKCKLHSYFLPVGATFLKTKIL